MATKQKDPKNVFVIHGRDEKARKSIYEFLRSIGLNPLEFYEFIHATGKGAPYVGEVLDKAFSVAQAAVVLLTPDDEARLRQPFRKESDPEYETELTRQARPNVLFEAGMALGHLPEKTILVQIGQLRPFSDLTGRHLVTYDNSVEKRNDLAGRLKAAECPVDFSGLERKLVVCSNLPFKKKIFENYKRYFTSIEQIDLDKIKSADLSSYHTVFLLPSEVGIEEVSQRKIIDYVQQGGAVLAFHDALHWMFHNEVLIEVTELKLNLGARKKQEGIQMEPITRSLDIEPLEIDDEPVSLSIQRDRDLETLMVDAEGKQPALVKKILGKGVFVYFKYGHNLQEILRAEKVQKMIFIVFSQIIDESKLD